jgi:hypothetical protein
VAGATVASATCEKKAMSAESSAKESAAHTQLNTAPSLHAASMPPAGSSMGAAHLGIVHTNPHVKAKFRLRVGMGLGLGKPKQIFVFGSV